MIHNKYKEYIFDKVLSSDVKIILPEINDNRVISAINKMKKIGFNFVDLNEFSENHNFYKNQLYSKDFIKNWTEEMVDKYIENSLIKGLLILDNDNCDCLVAGATISTAEVIKSSIRIVGVNNKWVSSCFLMLNYEHDNVFTYSDCGVIPEPNEEQLALIAFNAAKSHKLLTNIEPRVVFLSFSTKGSADHYKVKRMQDAVKIFSNKHPNIIHDGEMQFDAAINFDIAKNKNAHSILEGRGNVFIFPDLSSANIAYKITQHLGNFDAWGPLLNGLKKPIHDLSRGATIDDIINISAIAAFESLS